MARPLAAWGLDVGTTSMKALRLRREGANVVITAFDVVEHEKFLTEPDVDKDEITRTTLGKFLERNQVRGDPVFIGVPGSSTFARFVKLPPVEPKKVPEIVRFEAIQQIPFPLEQVNWDYQTFTSTDSPDVEVGIFAMKKELVAQVMSNFQQHKMVVQGVQMAPLAVFNAAMYDEIAHGKGTVVLDIGAEHTDLIFIDAGRLWLRTINIGGNNFTDALSKSFKVPFAKAEQLKRGAATSKYAKQVFQAMRPVFADLVAEVQRSIGFYNSSHRDAKLERVVGMGNPFKLPNLQKYLAQNLQMEVARLETFKKAVAEGKVAAGLAEHILGLAAAYGLALQGLDMAAIDTNLLPMDIARQMVWRQKRPWFAAAAAMVVVGVGVGGLRLYQDRSAYANTSQQVKEENETVLADAERLKKKFEGLKGTYDKDRDQVESLLKLAEDRKTWPMIYHDITSALPQQSVKQMPEARNLQPIIILKQILCDYKMPLSQAVAAQEAAKPEASAAVFDDMGGMPNRNTSAQPAGGISGTVGQTNPITADRGYIITLRGYTPYHDANDNGSKFTYKFMLALGQIAPAPQAPKSKDPKDPWVDPKPSKPYYFEFVLPGLYKGQSVVVKSSAAGSSYNGLPSRWGANANGPYQDAMVAEMMGIVKPTAGAGTAMQPVVDPLSKFNMLPMDPDVPGKDMNGYFSFETTFRVHLKKPVTPAAK